MDSEFKCHINWGPPLISLDLFIIFLTVIYLYYIIGFLATISREFQLKILFPLITILPIIMLNLVFLRITKSLFFTLVKKENPSLTIDSQGIIVDNEILEWKRIKSISFQTGRPFSDRTFNTGFKMPALQRMFLLDTSGKEYSCIIDIDYSGKEGRQKNNLLMARRHLVNIGKSSFLSDWAEKT